MRRLDYMSQQTHRSDPSILGRRRLEQDHRHLAPLIQSGMQVLDVGCGTGSITAGIAERVGSAGYVIGVDRDESLLAIAREQNAGCGNLEFVHGDAMDLPYEARFDIVTAARALQWMADPLAAARSMRRAAKSGGRIVILDYDHADNAWEPDPPPDFRRFWAAFLAWRAANGWDNRMASHLPALLAEAGCTDVTCTDSSEIAGRGEAAASIWNHVITTIGPTIVAADFLTAAECEAAAESYEGFTRDRLTRQFLAMKTAVARA